MTIRSAKPLAALVLLTALLVAACGGSSSSSTNTVPANVDVTVRAIEGISWNAKSFTATAKDGKVTIYGESAASIAHNLYVIDASGKAMGDVIDLPKRGSHGTRVLTLAPGTYHIVCKVPGHNNMNSVLTVS